MARALVLAAAQMGATHRTDSRSQTLERMLKLLDEAASKNANVVLFPEIAFTTFFPRYLIEDTVELESWFEHGDIVTAPQTKALFDKSREYQIDIAVGFAEATDDDQHFNSTIYYHARSGSVLAKYRKIHLPGDFEPIGDKDTTQQLEKRYFQVGDLGFNAFRVPDLAETTTAERGEPIFGMMICNDRRWAEAWRVLGLQGVEVVLCGYNTTGYAPELWGWDKDVEPEAMRELAVFQHKLSMQGHSYTNACFSVSAARCGLDDGKYDLVGGSCITDPEGRVVAEAKTTEDEVVVANCDLDLCRAGKTRIFNFAKHRRPEHYRLVTEQIGIIEPPHLSSQTPTNGDAAAETKTPPIETSTTTRNNNNNNNNNNKKIRILLINPNATKSMTTNCLKMSEPQLPPDVELTGFTTPPPAPTAVEGNFDGIMSAAAAMRALKPIAHGYDAFLIACYSDHPLIRMLREEFTQPSIGIMEASLFAARTLGNRFGLIATSRRSKAMHEDSIRHYGFEGFCAGVGSCGLGVLELESKGEAEVLEIMCAVAKDLVAKGADCLTLGCAGMTMLKPAVVEAVGEDVQVIDGVLAGVQHLSGLVRMGGRTAKSGMYASSAKGRKARGQTYF